MVEATIHKATNQCKRRHLRRTAKALETPPPDLQQHFRQQTTQTKTKEQKKEPHAQYSPPYIDLRAVAVAPEDLRSNIARRAARGLLGQQVRDALGEPEVRYLYIRIVRLCEGLACM